MKRLRNKETGESYETTMPIVFNIKTNGGGEHTVSCESITELNEKWEDVPEEPKGIVKVEKSIVPTCVHIVCATEEEAERVVERLKAFTRLEDKGFRFEGWLFFPDSYHPSQERARDGRILFRVKNDKEVGGLLDIVFGGEE